MKKEIITCIFFLFLIGFFCSLSFISSETIRNVPSVEYPTIQAAIDAAVDGDTINVAAGTYTESIIVNKEITIKGASSSTVIVNALNPSNSVFLITADNVNISEFTVSGATGGGQAGIYINAGVANCNISNNILTGNYDGVWLGSGSNHNTFENNALSSNYQGFEVYISNYNTFTNNDASMNNNYGFKIDSGDHNTFTDNIANSNTKYGFYVVIGDGGGATNSIFADNTANLNTQYGIRINGGSDNTLTGNTFDSNVLAGLRLKEDIINLNMDDNIISGSPLGIDIDVSVVDVTSWTLSNNKITDNTNYGVSNLGTGTLDAENNWWGDRTGPHHATLNPEGAGDDVSDNVDFGPWLECLEDSDCDDGLSCNGAETCSVAQCVAGTEMDCSGNNIGAIWTCSNSPDDNPFTLDYRNAFASTCDEEIDSCTAGDSTVNSAAPEIGVCGVLCLTNDDCNSLDNDYCSGTSIMHDEGVCGTDYTCSKETTIVQDCDNSLFCDGEETCLAAQCVAGIAPLIDDGLFCTEDSCDEVNDKINNNPLNVDDGFFCTVDSCDETNNEVDHDAKIVTDSIGCTDDSCDEVNDVIVNAVNNSNCNLDTICADYSCSATLDCQANYAPATTECRASGGNCDLAEMCTGSDALCPTDTKLTSLCRTSKGICDSAESCNGIDNDCPADVFEPATTECRAAIGNCDVPELCTGLSIDCPPLDNSLFMIINNPKTLNYGDKQTIFNISLFGTIDSLRYKDFIEVDPDSSTLCNDCDEYGESRKKTKTLKDGDHNLSFYAIKDENVVCEQNITFFIDSKKPNVLKTEPKKDFASGFFEVEFIEQNPVDLVLHYGLVGDFRQEKLNILNRCTIAESKYYCNITVNLSDYDEKEILYWFVLKDVVNKSEESREIDLKIDTSIPRVTNINPRIDGKYAYFSLNITEPNFEKAYYVDINDSRMKENRLCSYLKGNKCERKVTLDEGYHHLKIVVVDKAGNQFEDYIEFTTDSKSPDVIGTWPSRGKVVNGSEFYIKYTEENLKSIVLFWSNGTKELNCTAGKNQECKTSANLSSSDGNWITYWFNLSDGISSERSKEIRIKVDTKSPVLKINNPLNNGSYATKVPFNITIENLDPEEKVKIEYMDINVENPVWKTLCSNCNEYGAKEVKTKSFFKKELHNLAIRAVDKAGNSDAEEIEFRVV